MASSEITLEAVPSASDIPAAEWNACANPKADPNSLENLDTLASPGVTGDSCLDSRVGYNPFVSHAFFAAAEASFVAGTPTADNATFIINGGINGGLGGTLFFNDGSLGGTAQVTLSGNGTLDLTHHTPGTVSIRPKKSLPLMASWLTCSSLMSPAFSALANCTVAP